MNISELKGIFDNCELIDDKIVVHSDIDKTLEFIRDSYGFDMLKEITATDKKENGIELIYRLYSVENEEEVLISTVVKNETKSVSKIFDSAIADEKEIYDLFGINFLSNEELERLYMPESWKGHPLKKDYEENDERLSWNNE